MAPILSRVSSGFGFGKKGGSTTFSSNGGTIVDVGADRYHVFTSTASPLSLVTSSPATVEIMVVGSGGDTGAFAGGGGAGGGGIQYADNASLIAGTHTVVVGAPNPAATTGDDSSFTSATGWVLTARGGARGSSPQTATSGGSSSGSGYDTSSNNSTANQPSTTSNIPTPYSNYGNLGAPGGVGGYGGCGGGGGAGGAGSPGLRMDISPNHGSGGPGGNGQPFPSFGTTNIGPALPAPTQPFITANGLYGGGGGGATNANSGTSPSNRCKGGPGGGGDGARTDSTVGSAANSYGGGAGGNELEYGGGLRPAGFQGIVCVRIKNVN